MTSRGSPDSTTRPQRVREPSRTRWLCTAAVASRIGIGQRVASAPRSREHEDRVLRPHEPRGLLAELVERPLEATARPARVEQALERADAEAVGWQRAQLLEVARQQDGLGHRDPPGVLGRLVEEVPLRADRCAEAHHEGLALRVDRGVGDLGEVLLEVGRKQLRRDRRARRAACRRPSSPPAPGPRSPSARSRAAGPLGV